MFVKILYLLATVVVASIASPVNIIQSAPLQTLVQAPLTAVAHAPLRLTRPALTKEEEDFDPHPQYSYGYEVKDALTGDEKDQHETRDGDQVQGSYSLTEADGTKRIVEYTADPVNGFNAIIRKEGQKQQAITVGHAPLVSHAPLLSHAPILGHSQLLGTAPILGQPILSHAPLAYSLQSPVHIAPAGLATFLHR